MTALINILPLNATEWNRMAKDLRSRGYTDLAYRFEVNAMRTFMNVAEFDATQTLYREWMNNGHTRYPQR